MASLSGAHYTLRARKRQPIAADVDVLFADPRLAAAFDRATTAAQAAAAELRLRLCLDERDPLLHSLHWEALR
jgi:hypothetical protein